MRQIFRKWFKKEQEPIIAPVASMEPSKGFFNLDLDFKIPVKSIDQINAQVFQRGIFDIQRVKQQDLITTDGKYISTFATTIAEDTGLSSKSQFGLSSAVLPQAQVEWFGSQSFIGYQACALLSQNWLVNKVCDMPGKDAVRKGFEITVNDGVEIDPKILDEIKRYDKEFKLKKNMREFVRFGRIFGIRVAMFDVKSNDPYYYEKPFNIDGVTPGSYKGIIQIDPNWLIPQLNDKAAGDPGAMYFYEPTFWFINGLRVHRSHVVIFRNNEPPDILKPTYYFGGIPVPQEIYQRVYCAERTADEAPQLAASKRCTVINVDMEEAVANQGSFERRMQIWAYLMNNFGVKVLGLNEKAQQLETSLADLDAAIMTQYQLVAAAGRVPATKLLGTTPKGFSATGEYDEASYHEELESIQENDLTPFVNRHHELIIKSYILPKYKIPLFVIEPKWHSLDSTTAKEKAETNLIKAQTGVQLMTSGAIDGADERARIIADQDSGYNGISEEVPEPLPVEDPIPDEELEDVQAITN